MDDNLIFDMGCHKGEDKAYYLRRGFQVVAVEADPALCAFLETRFAREIATGQVILVCKAIAETAGTAAFFRATRAKACGAQLALNGHIGTRCAPPLHQNLNKWALIQHSAQQAK